MYFVRSVVSCNPAPKTEHTEADGASRDVGTADACGTGNLALGNLAHALEQLRAVN